MSQKAKIPLTAFNDLLSSYSKSALSLSVYKFSTIILRETPEQTYTVHTENGAFGQKSQESGSKSKIHCYILMQLT